MCYQWIEGGCPLVTTKGPQRVTAAEALKSQNPDREIMTNQKLTYGNQEATEARKDLLTIPELCQEVGLHPNTVRGYIRSGQLPAVYLGPRMIRIRRSDIEQLLTPYKAEASVWARPVR